MNNNKFLYYGIDIDMYEKDYGVVETVKSNLIKTKNFDEAKRFAEQYAKDPSNFNFKYLDENKCDYYEITIREYVKSNENPNNVEWDDIDSIIVKRPKKNKTH